MGIRGIWRRHVAVVLFFAALIAAGSACAGGLPLSPPIDMAAESGSCILGYVDVDPGPAYRDYHGGRLSYNGHKGTDFYVPWNRAFSPEGVVVRAAAAGVVRAVRDGEPDLDISTAGTSHLKGRDAGNAVVIAHADGFETQYSHLRKGSVKVRPGQMVEAGTPLGLVGLSGRTEFPHVELAVRRRGIPVCPFCGRSGPSGGGDVSLWTPKARKILSYVAGGILGCGFCGRAPTLDCAKRGQCRGDRLSRRSPALVYWVLAYGVVKGDVLKQEILSPQGTEFASNEVVLEKTQTLHLRYIGKKRSGGVWPEGEYEGTAELLRGGDVRAGASGRVFVQ